MIMLEGPQDETPQHHV
ncbi:unnamed protein product, partial [Didymodactylos carnosus]